MSRRPLTEIGTLALGVAVALAFRAFVYSLYFIPSESMLPTLLPGDIMVVSKWPFRLLHRLPRRGEIVVFKAPPLREKTFVKRVIGLPGDVVELRKGVPWLNGRPFARTREADLVQPTSPATPCRPEPLSWIKLETRADGTPSCRYPHFAERLPGGRRYDVLDLGNTVGDTFGPVRVPPGHLFLMGDNRDRSADSRFAPGAQGGIGMVPLSDLRGSASRILISNDGSARWDELVSWWGSIRWERTGLRL